MTLDVENDPMSDLLERCGDQPIVVVNLVRLKPGGEAVHARYLESVDRILERYGATPRYTGVGVGTLIGDEEWHKAAITTYPSAKVLAQFIDDPEFLALAPLRHEALEAGVVHVFNEA